MSHIEPEPQALVNFKCYLMGWIGFWLEIYFQSIVCLMSGSRRTKNSAAWRFGIWPKKKILESHHITDGVTELRPLSMYGTRRLDGEIASNHMGWGQTFPSAKDEIELREWIFLPACFLKDGWRDPDPSRAKEFEFVVHRPGDTVGAVPQAWRRHWASSLYSA